MNLSLDRRQKRVRNERKDVCQICKKCVTEMDANERNRSFISTVNVQILKQGTILRGKKRVPVPVPVPEYNARNFVDCDETKAVEILVSLE